MKIETIEIHNFKVFQNVKLENIGSLAVFLGENGVGKSTLFDVFGFVQDCLMNGVRTALQRRGGYDEVHSRGKDGDISFLFKYRITADGRLCTYELHIGLDANRQPLVNKERLRYKRNQMTGQPWNFIDFTKGKGRAITNKGAQSDKIKDAERENRTLDSPDLLAISSLGQMKEFKAASEFRNFLKDWFVSDFQIDRMRLTQEIDYNETLNRKGDNLANVAQFLYDRYPDRFQKVLQKMQERIPGVSKVEAKTNEDGSGILLKFQDGRFKDPFSSRYVSDGTIKMFAYLIMFAEPNPHSLLCIEEPENQLYPHLLEILAEEFREYTETGGQVFVSTHSPDLVNAIEPQELYFISKQKDGFSQIRPMSKNELVVRLYNEGDKLGWLWQEGLLTHQ